MITLTLLPHAEKLAPANPRGLEPAPLYHQMRTYEALRHFDVVMNTYNTGTGKTVASLLRLFDLDRQGRNVLFIAPTNALLAQHAEDIARFVQRNELDFEVLQMTASEVRSLSGDLRSGEIVQRLIRNYLEFDDRTSHRRPIILVVNPDIFYYALFFQYGPHDRRNVFERFVNDFDYIVVDEFHYYDSKQLANFLFAMALFDQLGYFEARERKICLLSATPLPHVAAYLNQLFPERWKMIAPENEPSESAAYPTTPTLAPLELTVLNAEFQEWVGEHCTAIRTWVGDGEHGALISNSLWRVNQAWEALCVVLPSAQLGRITGPEPPEKRAAVTFCPIVLATPTVDIGYNFNKHNKARQNIDFLVCDARFGDELLQRVGRAGRVLGKAETQQPSRAFALLTQEAAEALKDLDGQTLDRTTFKERVEACDLLPPKHNLTGYIRSWAIVECFYPLFEFHKMLPEALHPELETLFDRLRDVFAPYSRRTFKGIKGFFYKYQSRQLFLAGTKKGNFSHDKYTADHMADFIAVHFPEYGRPRPADIQSMLGNLLNTQERRDSLRAFVQSQMAITQALFNFRDSFQGPRAVVHDPHHLLSSERINAYDLFHLISHYRLSAPMSKAQFQDQFGENDLQGDFWFAIRGWREPRIIIEFSYRSQEDREDFERKWCRQVVGLAGLRVQARQAGGDVVMGELPENIVDVLAGDALAALILLPEDGGAAWSRLRGTPVISRRLTVSFPDGTADDGFRIFAGKAAFEAHAELVGYFKMKDRLKPEVIII